MQWINDCARKDELHTASDRTWSSPVRSRMPLTRVVLTEVVKPGACLVRWLVVINHHWGGGSGTHTHPKMIMGARLYSNKSNRGDYTETTVRCRSHEWLSAIPIIIELTHDHPPGQWVSALKVAKYGKCFSEAYVRKDIMKDYGERDGWVISRTLPDMNHQYRFECGGSYLLEKGP